MSKATLLELADRVEKASGPDRELDCLIFEGQHKLLTPDRRGSIDGEPTGQYFDLNGEQLPECAPRYTASLDAAMTLLGRNAIQSLSYWPFVAKGYESELCCRLTLIEVTQNGFGGKHHYRADAKTPALALTAAAIRARAQQESSDADQ
jgi:hypothetical protein